MHFEVWPEHMLHNKTFQHLQIELVAVREVKSLSSRKAEKGDHTSDFVADSLLRLILAMRFRSKGEPTTTGAHHLLSKLVECRWEMSLV